jgi:hypothetical protein
MHRLGNGTRVPDIKATRRIWFRQGRTVSTYPNKGEYDAFRENKGRLVAQASDGQEVRVGATIKTVTRGGTLRIVHNCVVTGNPEAYKRWKADPRSQGQKGWYPQWTFYPRRDLDEVLRMLRDGTRHRPVSVTCIETGKPIALP